MLERLKQLATEPPPWWAWPALLLVMGVGAVAASLVFYPGGDEWTYIMGQRFGAGCTIQELTGMPCPSCGMTRSWVHLSRFEILTSLRYNAAGSVLLLWLAFGGILGAVRLARRDERAIRLPYNIVAGFGLFWMLGLYIGLWLLRVFGVNPLP